MRLERQEWKERNIEPLLNNSVDILIIEKVPCSQLQIYQFVTEHYRMGPQDPMDMLFVDIVSKGYEDTFKYKGTTELEWHIDKGYSDHPFDVVGLYSVIVDGDAGETQFVDGRICDQIPEYFKENQNAYLQFNMEKFLYDPQYGYHFRNEKERRFFKRKYGKPLHKMFKEDKAGPYLFFCEAYNRMESLPKEITDILYDPDRIYTHKWRSGELILYNNKATNHKRKSSSSTQRHLWRFGCYET